VELPLFDPAQVSVLAAENPDTWWKQPEGGTPLERLDQAALLRRARCLRQEGEVCGLRFSEDGRLMASASTAGTLKVWDVEEDWKELRTLRDLQESQLDEFYCLRFTPDARYLFAAGKRKDRESWSEVDDDNACLASPIKLFDVSSGEVVLRLDQGHTEEVLVLKMARFQGKNYLLSGSQDGYIWRWQLSDDFRCVCRAL
jgi:WD40 repeat protein